MDGKLAADIETRRSGPLDHDDLGSNRPESINGLDSKALESATGKRRVSTFPHPALAAPPGKRTSCRGPDRAARTFGEGREVPGGAFTREELAEEFGIDVQAIGFYEDVGLLEPRRDVVGPWVYGSWDRLHLKMILKGTELGFTVSEIREILAARASEAKIPDLGMDAFSITELGAIGTRPRGKSARDPTKHDFTLGLRSEQIIAQIDYLERQRQALDEAIRSLREAHHRRVAQNSARMSR
jgi:DNA-binding transcriptional MerR regulator